MSDQQRKPPLGEYVHKTLMKEFGSLPEASKKIGIPYERLKANLGKNRFNEEDFKILFPDKTPEEMYITFSFSMARQYNRLAPKAAPKDIGRALEEAGMDDLDTELILENKAVARKIALIIHRECEELRKVLNIPRGAA